MTYAFSDDVIECRVGDNTKLVDANIVRLPSDVDGVSALRSQFPPLSTRVTCDAKRCISTTSSASE